MEIKRGSNAIKCAGNDARPEYGGKGIRALSIIY
jgi:hypothetical protein